MYKFINRGLALETQEGLIVHFPENLSLPSKSKEMEK